MLRLLKERPIAKREREKERERERERERRVMGPTIVPKFIDFTLK